MKTLLYITSSFRRCGPVNQLFNLVSRLKGDQYKGVILSLSPEGEDSMKGRFEKLGIQIDSLFLGRLQGMIAGKRMLVKYIRQLQPDIIHTQGFRPDSMASGLDGFPVVSTIRMDPGMDYPMKFGKIMGAWMKHKHLSVIKKNENAVLCSRSLQKLFLESYGIRRKYIPNGVDTKEFKPASKKEKALLREQFHIPEGSYVFIYTGSLIKRKNLHILLKAFMNLSEKALLLIAGDGDMMQELKQQASGNKNILFMGQRSDIKNLLQLSDAFVSPSLSEGLPNTVLEAMAIGLPVLLSNIPQHREIFSGHDWQNFFPVTDDVYLGKLMDRMIHTRPEAADMLDIIHNSYSADIMAKRYQELYKSILT